MDCSVIYCKSESFYSAFFKLGLTKISNHCQKVKQPVQARFVFSALICSWKESSCEYKKLKNYQSLFKRQLERAPVKIQKYSLSRGLKLALLRWILSETKTAYMETLKKNIYGFLYIWYIRYLGTRMFYFSYLNLYFHFIFLKCMLIKKGTTQKCSIHH